VEISVAANQNKETQNERPKDFILVVVHIPFVHLSCFENVEE
jgi:hypothetical protein